MEKKMEILIQETKMAMVMEMRMKVLIMVH